MKLFSPALLIEQLEACDPAEIPGVVAELRAAIEYTQKSDPLDRLGLPLEVHLNRIVSLAIAAKLRGSSVDSLERHFSEHFVDLGPGKRGIRIKDALFLNDPPRKPRVRAQTSPTRARKAREREREAS